MGANISLYAHPLGIVAAPSAIKGAFEFADILRSNARLVSVKPLPPAVVISPSQLGVYDQCNRRWAWENIAGFRSPPTRSQILGTRVHAVLEAYLRHGTPPNRKTLEGRIALKGLACLPPPGVGSVEKQFYLTTRRGLHYTGIADWIGWNPQLGAMVIDHKTTSSMIWAKTPEELEYDVQALLYATFACISMLVDRVTLRWNYVQTNAKDARVVELTLHLAQIIERFPIVEARAAEMTAHRKKRTHPLRVLPNPLACANFGGCPHQARCNLSPAEKMEAIMANEQNGTMREHMTALTNYRPPNPDGSFPLHVPPGIPQAGTSPGYAGTAPGYPPGVNPVSQYLPPGPTQLEASQAYAAPAQQAPAPGYVNYAPQAFTQPPVAQPPGEGGALGFVSNVAPFYQDPASGYLVDAQTRQFLPPSHPAYQYPDSYRPYQVAPPAPEPQPSVFQGQPPQALQAQQAQYPTYSPHSGPNAPEQHEDPSQIPAVIATPPLQVAGIDNTGTQKKRGRRTKAEIEAARLAAGGPAEEKQAAAAGGPIAGEEMVFIYAVQGALANPQLAINTVTVEQLVYIGNLAREAFNRTFGV